MLHYCQITTRKEKKGPPANQTQSRKYGVIKTCTDYDLIDARHPIKTAALYLRHCAPCFYDMQKKTLKISDTMPEVQICTQTGVLIEKRLLSIKLIRGDGNWTNCGLMIPNFGCIASCLSE